jgi:hypothetical protein
MSTGLNMPARTVVFTSPRKFDGAGYRQGLTLVHISAQPEPFLAQNTP